MEVIDSGLENLSLEQQKELKEKQELEDIDNSYNNYSNNKNELNKNMEIFNPNNNNSDSENENNNSDHTTDDKNSINNNNNNSNENTSNDTISEFDSLPSSPSIRSSGVFSASSSTSSFSNLGTLVSPGGQSKLQSSSSSSLLQQHQQLQQQKKVVEGELTKRGHIFPTWKTRWFKISNGYLLYFKSKDDTEPIDKVPLRGSRVSKKPFHERPNTFELIATTMKKVFLLQAKDVDDLDYWIDEIVKETEYTRSLYSRTIHT